MIISINTTLCHTFQRLALLLAGRPGRQWKQCQPASQQQPAGPKQRHSCGGRRTARCPPGHTAAGGPSGLSALSPAHEIPSKGTPTLSDWLLYFSKCLEFVNLIFRLMVILNVSLLVSFVDCVADLVHVCDAAFGQFGVSHITRWESWDRIICSPSNSFLEHKWNENCAGCFFRLITMMNFHDSKAV